MSRLCRLLRRPSGLCVVSLLANGKDLSTGEIIKEAGSKVQPFNRFAPCKPFSYLDIYGELPRFENSRNVEM